MTVIAFDGHQMAADSLCTAGDYRLTTTPKIFKLKGGGILGGAGDDDIRAVISLLDNCKDEDDLPSRDTLAETKCDCRLLLYLPNKKLYQIGVNQPDKDRNFWDGYVSEIKAPIAAVGHGDLLALGAMQRDLDAKQTPDAVAAVKVACKWSRFCEEPVQSMPVEGFSTKRKSTLKRTPPKKDTPQAEAFAVDINSEGGATLNIEGRKFKVKAIDEHPSNT